MDNDSNGNVKKTYCICRNAVKVTTGPKLFTTWEKKL